MTTELKKAIEIVKEYLDMDSDVDSEYLNAQRTIIEALEAQSIDKSTMMYEIYMEGVNMTGEYQGCWVRFKDIEKIVDKYMAESEGADERNT